MKELSIEEKAMAYDKAIEIAKEINNEQKAQPFDIMTRVFPELKESKDEKIKKVIRGWIYTRPASFFDNGISKEEILAWLEKQGEHANFLSKIQVGDKVTRNEDGMLVNLSQLDRVAKQYNITGIGSKNAQGKLGEMIKNLKPADNVEPNLYNKEYEYT